MSESPEPDEKEMVGPVGRAIVARVQIARAEFLRVHKKDLLWSEIARQMSWKEGTVSAVRNLKRSVHLEEVPRLAAIVGAREAWLFCGEGEISDSNSRKSLPTPDSPPAPGAHVDLSALEAEENRQQQEQGADQQRRAVSAGGAARPIRRAGKRRGKG